MNKTLLLGATALRTVAAGGLALALAGPAYAQDAQAPADQTAPVAQTEEQAPAVQPSEVELQSNTTADSKQEVIVTGSRIRRPNLESTVPVTSIGGEQLLRAGQAQRRRHAERSAAAPQHLLAAEPGPRHRHRRPQPARPSRPRHVSAPWCWSTAAATSQRTFSTTPFRPTSTRSRATSSSASTSSRAATRPSTVRTPSPASSTSFFVATSKGFRSAAQASALAKGPATATSMCRPCTARTSPRTARNITRPRRICQPGPRLRLRPSLVA